MRFSVLSVFLFLTACGPSSAPAPRAAADPTTEPWYSQTVNELATMNRQAEDFFREGKQDEAAALIEKGEPLSDRLLAAPKPTLAATEAASDLDQLYGEMLFSNHNYGWARLMFQRNLSRWKHWMPRTPEAEKRLKLAEDAIEKCDRHITE